MVCHLLGTIDFDVSLALQHRLVYESSADADGQITLLVCEHPTTITIGRQGSRADVHLDSNQLRTEKLDVRWANRGGGALVHGPGQLAVYPIVPLATLGLTVGQYLDRLQEALSLVLAEESIATARMPGSRGLWGRSGQLVAIASAVRSWTTYFGAYVNVAPPMRLMRHVDAISGRHSPMSSLGAERQQPVRMTSLRERVARHVAAAFGVDHYHLYSGHPLLAPMSRPQREATARAG